MSGEKEEIAVRGPVAESFPLCPNADLGANTDTDTDIALDYRDDRHTPTQSEPLRKLAMSLITHLCTLLI